MGEDGDQHNVKVTIDPAPTLPFTLNYTLGGSATEDEDYSISGSGAVSVTAGLTSVNIPIVITDDDVDENNETVILTLISGREYTLVRPEHTLTITDNDTRNG